jgi:DNA mismatch repair protein MutS2
MSEDWKLALLKKLWSGEETDPQKKDIVKKNKKSIAANTKWSEIDLHRYHDLSDQLAATEKAIESAILANVNGIRIIHGKGEGILRAEVLKLLKHHPHILNFESEKDQYGETGVVKIRFK